jgi:1-acyl-sn-glycerol-3-phosphate acyltransferase
MIFLRSLLLTLYALVVTPPYSLLAIATFPLPPLERYRIISGWARAMMWVLRHLCRMDYRVLGRENIPASPSVILAKHQSAWETMAFQAIFPPQVFVMKKELMKVPFFGWGLAQLPMISIDRNAGKDALQQVVEQGRDRLQRGFWIVIFPEGTRVAPGSTRRYKVGGAYLAAQTGAAVVPVAHNAGEFWRRRAFLKYPGTITVSVGPAIDPTGLSAEEINARARSWIEGEMQRLFPHHYGAGRDAAAPSTVDLG